MELRKQGTLINNKEVVFEPSVAELEILFNIMDRDGKGFVNKDDMLRIANVKNENLRLIRGDTGNEKTRGGSRGRSDTVSPDRG